MIERSESMSGAGEAGANLSDLLGVISLFEQMKADYIKRYMQRERVSLAMMMERETFEERCDWAIAMLRRKINDA